TNGISPGVIILEESSKESLKIFIEISAIGPNSYAIGELLRSLSLFLEECSVRLMVRPPGQMSEVHYN
ncbi:hypothetical protein NPIL_508341, partial [Nephila pilipes]